MVQASASDRQGAPHSSTEACYIAGTHPDQPEGSEPHALPPHLRATFSSRSTYGCRASSRDTSWSPVAAGSAAPEFANDRSRPSLSFARHQPEANPGKESSGRWDSLRNGRGHDTTENRLACQVGLRLRQVASCCRAILLIFSVIVLAGADW